MPRLSWCLDAQRAKMHEPLLTFVALRHISATQRSWRMWPQLRVWRLNPGSSRVCRQMQQEPSISSSKSYKGFSWCSSKEVNLFSHFPHSIIVGRLHPTGNAEIVLDFFKDRAYASVASASWHLHPRPHLGTPSH